MKDNETGLDFEEARMYDNRFGRFTAVDPLLASGNSANPQTFNRYVYVGNRPLMRTDPSGLIWGVNKHGHVRWFDKKLGKGFSEFRPNNWQYQSGTRTVRLDPNSSSWSYVFRINIPPPPSNRIGDFLKGFRQGFQDTQTGAAKGVGNLAIDALNSATELAIRSQYNFSPYVPNPLAIERYQVYSEVEARWSIGVQVGLTLASGAATAPFRAATTLSVVPKSPARLETGGLNLYKFGSDSSSLNTTP